MSSPCVGIYVGSCGDADNRPRKQKTYQACIKCKFIWHGYMYCSGSAFARLDQIQLDCPFDSRPAIIDIEFAVDALCMCADRTQADHEFTGDFRTGKLGLEQAENFQLTLAERLNEVFN